jgi:hypothetical protein
MKSFLENQQDFLKTIEKASKNDKESLKYLINLTYGQIVFSPRNDYFIQAKYLSKLPFGNKNFFVIPKEGYGITGPAPLPREFRDHLKSLTTSNPDLLDLYKDLHFK